MRESMIELYDKGAYGDQQLRDYIEAFLGEDNWQKILNKNNGNLKAAIDESVDQINSYGNNLYGVWNKLINKGLQGVSLGDKGQILFDLEKIGDTNKLK
jgi:hypothetical protein